MATAKKPAPKTKSDAPKKAAKAPKAEAPAKKAAAKAEVAPKSKKTTKKVEAEVEVAVAAVVEAPKKAPAKKAAASAPDVHVDAILAAIREGRAVEFIFADADANAPRTFEPRQLSFDALAQAWYVFGWDRRYNAERHHRLDLLAEVNPVEGVGRSAQGPYAEGTPGNQIGGWLGGDAIAVKATLQKQWVFAIKQAPPAFPKFKITDKEDGRAEVTFTATDLRAIARWVMQFGDGITVQEPQRLADRLRQVASVWAGKDLAKPSAPAPAPRPEHREERPRHQEPRHEPRHESRHEAKPEGKGPKVEIRIERL
jgi:predicted DNA-binding transcriptional regulator YafY